MEPVDESSKTAGGTTVEDLERFRQEIERYRARRKAVSDEFEGFVQGFKKPIEPAPAPPPVIRATAAPPREPLPVRPPAAVTPSSFAEQRAVRAAPAPLTPAVIPSVAPASRRSVSRALPLLVLVGLMGGMLATYVMTRFENALQSHVAVAFFVLPLLGLVARTPWSSRGST